MQNLLGSLVFSLAIYLTAAQASEAVTPGKWEPIFNGKNLDGWTPKIRGYALGDNFGDTFRVEDGVMKVVYDKYDKFNDRFGHIFYRERLTNYVLRVEYRFVGDQTPGGAGWAFRNSGIMLHCQAPETMAKDQDFPVSVEVQLLGGDGKTPRTTGNVCSPGTHIVMGGKLVTSHCNSSKSKTYHGDQWVAFEVEVQGGKVIRHKYEGETVLEYSQPQLDETDASARRLLEQGEPKMVESGYISLQSESHSVQFRKVELMRLP